MPTFDTLPLNEARANSATGQRAALLQEYIGYIQRVGAGQAGKLGPGEGETTQAIRRRLTAAAEALGKELQVRRSANTVCFWVPEVGDAAGLARARPRSLPSRVPCPTTHLFLRTSLLLPNQLPKRCGTRGLSS